MAQQFIKFADIGNNPLSNTKVKFRPWNPPFSSGSVLGLGNYPTDRLTTDSNGYVTASLFNGLYEIVIDSTDPITKVYGSISESIYTPYSASLPTGSRSDVVFNIQDIFSNWYDYKTIKLTTKDINIFFSGSVISVGNTSSFTNESGSVTFTNLVPGVKFVEALSDKPDVRTTSWFIRTPDNGVTTNAVDLRVFTFTQGIPVKLNPSDAGFVGSIAFNDNRYIQGVSGSATTAISSSHSITASFASVAISASLSDTASLAIATRDNLTADYTFWIDKNRRYHVTSRDYTFYTSSTNFSDLFQYVNDSGSVDGVITDRQVKYDFASTAKMGSMESIHYVFQHPVILTKTCHLNGQGDTAAFFSATKSYDGPLVQFGDDDHYINGSGIVENIRFEAGDSTGSNTGVYWKNCGQPIAINSQFNNCVVAGLRISNTTASYNSYITNCGFGAVQNDGAAILIDSNAGNNGVGQSEINIAHCQFALARAITSSISVTGNITHIRIDSNRFFWSGVGAFVPAITISTGSVYSIQDNIFENYDNSHIPILFVTQSTATSYKALVQGNLSNKGTVFVESGSGVSGVVVTNNIGNDSVVHHVGDGSGLTGIISSQTASYLNGSMSGSSVMTTDIEVIDGQPDVAVRIMDTTQYGRYVFKSGSAAFNEVGSLQYIGSNFVTVDRRNALEVYQSKQAPIIFFIMNQEQCRITGSKLIGTASYADTASYITASNIVGTVLSASYAPVQPSYSASVAIVTNGLQTQINQTTESVSRALTATSASWASASITASYAPVQPSYSASISTQFGTKQDTLVVGGTYPITASRAVSAANADLLGGYWQAGTDGGDNVWIQIQTDAASRWNYNGATTINTFISDVAAPNFVGNFVGNADTATAAITAQTASLALTASYLTGSGKVVTPTEANDIVNKAYVDAINVFGLDFYFRTASVDNNGTSSMLRLTTPLSASVQDIVRNSVTTNQYAYQFISAPLGVTNLSQGSYTTHFHIYRVGGNNSNTIYPELYITQSTGITELVPNGSSISLITATTANYDVQMVLTSSVAISVNDRLILKFKVGDATGTPNLHFLAENNTAAGLTVPVQSSNFVLRAGDTMTGTLNGTLFNGPLTGSSFGTASWARNSITASSTLTIPSQISVTAITASTFRTTNNVFNVGSTGRIAGAGVDLNSVSDTYFSFNTSGDGATAFNELYQNIYHLQSRTVGGMYFEVSATYTDPAMWITTDKVVHISGSLTASMVTAQDILVMPHSSSTHTIVTTNPKTGSVYYNAGSNLMYVYNGVAWRSSSFA